MSGRVVKEEGQRGVKKEEQLMGGRVALSAALAAAAIAVWQEGIARTRVSTGVPLLVAPVRVDFAVRASSGSAGASPGDPAPPLLAAAPFRGFTVGHFSRPWQRARSVSRRRCRVLQQVLAAGAFGLERVLSWVMPARDARPCSVELGDVTAEEECLELAL